MNQSIRISHPEQMLFSHWSAPGKTVENSGRILSWISEKNNSPNLISCVAGFDNVRYFNSLQIDAHKEHRAFFPSTFRIDISNDGIVWEPIIGESDLKIEEGTGAKWNFSLIAARYIKFLVLTDKTDEQGNYFSAFGEFRVLISGIVALNVSSELDRLWVKENLIDERKDYGWSSALKAKQEKEDILLDLGSVNQVTELRMLSKNDPETFFPDFFQISYSEDNISWHHLLEENGFLVEAGTWYRWRVSATNMRFLKVTIMGGAKTREGKFISQIIEIEMYADPEHLDKSLKVTQGPPPYASVLRSGIVRLAMNGEEKESVVIQGNDRRLKKATTETPGIVELCSDGEDSPDTVVQGNDRRLKYATEDLPGIVRLARDEEIRAGHVLQSTDSRLRSATEEYSGIVELAANGENRAGTVVQGNDKRLLPATTTAPGIVKLAENGSDKINEVVQGNDRRLKGATVESPGIVSLSMAGEVASGKVVQSDDPRIQHATTENYGIVRLSRNGDTSGDRVVLANDDRLKHATESNAGIVELSSHGSSLNGRAVQASDPRLSDPREALPHKHEYAPLHHDLSDHSGFLSLKGATGEPYNTLAAPPHNHAPVTGENSGGGAGVSGKGVRDGVVGTGKSCGIVGFGLEEGMGVVGAAKKGPGGYFLSEKGYSLVAGGEHPERALFASELALLVRGRTRFMETVCFGGTGPKDTAAIACFMPVDEKDVIVDGDVLIAATENGILRRSREYGSPYVMGVVVGDANIILNAPESYAPTVPSDFASTRENIPPKGVRLIAIGGIVHLRVTASNKPIRPGDLLVSSSNSGRAEKFQGKEFRPGMIFARSLDSLSEGEGVIRALLSGF